MTTDQPSARVPLVDLATPGGGEVAPNLQRALANSPELAQGVAAFADAVRFASSLPADLIELAILRTAVLQGAAYPFAHHVPIARRHGVTDEQLDAIASWEGAGCFDGTERAVLRAVDELVGRAQLDDATHDDLVERFEPRAVLELIGLVSFYACLAMMANGLRVPVDQRVLPGLEGRWPPRG
jgi:4-carboxymuconolactone decarboxylase